jgi:hypothetical protein
MLQIHGLSLTYNSVATGTYDVETGTSAITKTPYVKQMFPKQIVANTYNYPTLVGKEVVMFYLANDSLGFTPKVNDEITYKSLQYKVQSLSEYITNGEIVLYKIITARG